MDLRTLINVYQESNPKIIDIVICIIWFYKNINGKDEVDLALICKEIEASGYAKQNKTVLRNRIKKDKRLLSKPNDHYSINIKYKAELDNFLNGLMNNKPVVHTSSVIDSDLFINSRKYTQKVIYQLNTSYKEYLYDCTAVMCRRLIETLIIESYENINKESEILGADGHYLMLAGLVTKIESSPHFHLGRNAKTGLKDLKLLGDLSAHNRRYNARQTDIDKIKQNLRVTSEELLHLAGQSPN